MNYTIVINGFVWVACMAYYFLFARKWYTGPKMTVDGVEEEKPESETAEKRDEAHTSASY